MSKNNSVARCIATISGMQPGAVEMHRDSDGTGLFIYLDPDKQVAIRIDLRPGFGDLEQSRAGLAELSAVAAQAAQEIAELQAAEQVTEASGG